MLLADLDAPRKQRLTAKRAFDRLVDEHQAVISYSTVRQYVKARRAAIAVESGNARRRSSCPRYMRPGPADVDFGDVWVDLAGVRTRCYMFAFRLSNSGKSVHPVYPTCGQEASPAWSVGATDVRAGLPGPTGLLDRAYDYPQSWDVRAFIDADVLEPDYDTTPKAESPSRRSCRLITIVQYYLTGC